LEAIRLLAPMLIHPCSSKRGILAFLLEPDWGTKLTELRVSSIRAIQRLAPPHGSFLGSFAVH
jgi:hypothetical protein